MTEPRFLADEGSVIATLGPEERKFLSQVLDLLADVGEAEGDPAAARLTIPVYLDDPEANDEWWRLMGDELETSRASDRAVYERVLASDDPVTLDVAEAEAFMRVLNEGRLAFSARFGFEVEEDHDKLPVPHMLTLAVLQWVLDDLTTELSKTI